MTAIDVGEQLKVLIDLQSVDQQLYELHQQRQAKPIQIEQLRAVYQTETQQGKAREEQVKALQVKRAGLEGDLASKESGIKKLQMQLYQVKTNKEYSALQHEIEGVKADNSVLEEEILKLMEQVDVKKAELAAMHEVLKGKEAQVRQAVTAIEREIADLDVAIAALQTDRQTIVPRIDPQVLGQYERVMKRKEGLGLVPVRVQQEACGGCHMNIPPQTINEIRLKERFIRCESCSRILYYPEDTAA